MKLADLALNTVYADRDGRATVLVSLDKFVSPESYTFGSSLIRPKLERDKTFGVIAVRATHRGQATHDELLAEASRLAQDTPAKASYGRTFEVAVVPLASIVRTWVEHLAVVKAEGEARHAANLKRKAEREARAELIARVKDALPNGVTIYTHEGNDHAQIRLEDLAAILTTPAPTLEGPLSARDRALLAAGFDKAVESLVYDDGSPLEVVATTNPFRG